MTCTGGKSTGVNDDVDKMDEYMTDTEGRGKLGFNRWKWESGDHEEDNEDTEHETSDEDGDDEYESEDSYGEAQITKDGSQTLS